MRVFSRLAVTIIFIAGLCLSAWAADFEYKEYEVQRGDTLWDIAQQELEDPFNWPIVWRENPQLQNPDRIYPGQVIRIPVGLLKQPTTVPEVMPEKVEKVEAPASMPVKEAPVERPLEISRDIVEITADDIRMSSYISREIPRDGYIADSPARGLVMGVGDEIYIKRIVEKKEVPAPFYVGDRFYIVRNTEKVKHPETREFMGYLIRVLGIAEVERVGLEDVTARITKMYERIENGDLLDAYYDVSPVILTGESRKPEVDGYVLASIYMRSLSSQLQVVFIDKGSNDGLQAGDVIATLAPKSLDRENGVLRIVNTMDETSTALVLHSVKDIDVGDGVASCALVEGCAMVH